MRWVCCWLGQSIVCRSWRIRIWVWLSGKLGPQLAQQGRQGNGTKGENDGITCRHNQVDNGAAWDA
jgi:hypothetical protein